LINIGINDFDHNPNTSYNITQLFFDTTMHFETL